ncbi:MAG: glycosyltransferase family 4 protein [Planctomycetales bacterium]|nr:glycosyltransferase family 4 protein [Planctomycetales bacterium]
MLVYDIQPDALIGAGIMKMGPAASLWRKINRVILNNADAVFTIGEYMAEKLEKNFNASKTSLGHIAVIHNWGDTESIKPLPREENPFVRDYKLEDSFIVLYSGNIGATHDTETLIGAAQKLKSIQDIKFVIFGEGAKKQTIVDAKEKYGLDNVIIMSYLPQSQIHYSFPSADVSIVTISAGVEGCLVPCKFYSYLAAGSAVLAICNPECEVAEIVAQEKCGKVIALGDDAALAASILHYYKNKDDLDRARVNSRNAAMQKYSRKNTQLYIDKIEKIYPGCDK